MNPIDQRIAIAELNGYKWTAADCEGGYKSWHDFVKHYGIEALDSEGMPDYLNDLNAMHEVELKLDESVVWYYSDTLMAVCKMKALHRSDFNTIMQNAEEDGFNSGDVLAAVTATAAQRAEAYLRVTNNWTSK